MRKHRISFLPQAAADLIRIYRHIAAASGPAVAGAYVDRIEAASRELETFPKRGRNRDDIRRGLRTIGFEKRATIVFQVRRTEVVIVRIFYGGRDVERLLRRTNGD